jgi:uncharacterized protein (DUF2062 family)
MPHSNATLLELLCAPDAIPKAVRITPAQHEILRMAASRAKTGVCHLSSHLCAKSFFHPGRGVIRAARPPALLLVIFWTVKRSPRSRNRLYRICRYAYLKCVRQNHAPERIGRGMGLGVFVAIFPTLWFGPVLTVAAAGVLGANRAAALAGNVLCGPLTPFTWTLSALVGNWMVSAEWRIAASLIEQRNLSEAAARSLATFLIGNLVVSAAFALLGYACAWWLAQRYRLRKLAAAAQADGGAA